VDVGQASHIWFTSVCPSLHTSISIQDCSMPEDILQPELQRQSMAFVLAADEIEFNGHDKHNPGPDTFL